MCEKIEIVLYEGSLNLKTDECMSMARMFQMAKWKRIIMKTHAKYMLKSISTMRELLSVGYGDCVIKMSVPYI